MLCSKLNKVSNSTAETACTCRCYAATTIHLEGTPTLLLSPTTCLLRFGRKPSYCNKTSELFFSGNLRTGRVKRGTLISVRLELTYRSYLCFPLPPYLLRLLSCSLKRLYIPTLITIQTTTHALPNRRYFHFTDKISCINSVYYILKLNYLHL